MREWEELTLRTCPRFPWETRERRVHRNSIKVTSSPHTLMSISLPRIDKRTPTNHHSNSCQLQDPSTISNQARAPSKLMPWMLVEITGAKLHQPGRPPQSRQEKSMPIWVSFQGKCAVPHGLLTSQLRPTQETTTREEEMTGRDPTTIDSPSRKSRTDHRVPVPVKSSSANSRT